MYHKLVVSVKRRDFWKRLPKYFSHFAVISTWKETNWFSLPSFIKIAHMDLEIRTVNLFQLILYFISFWTGAQLSIWTKIVDTQWFWGRKRWKGENCYWWISATDNINQDDFEPCFCSGLREKIKGLKGHKDVELSRRIIKYATVMFYLLCNILLLSSS